MSGGFVGGCRALERRDAGGLSPLWSMAFRRGKPTARRLIDRLAGPFDDMLHVLVDGTATGVAIIDRYGRIVRANEALRRMVDSDCNLSPGQPAQAIFCKDQHEEVWKQLAPALAGRPPPHSFISMLPSTVGLTVHTVEITAIGVREADGSVSGAILHFSDITAQAKLEAQLVQSQKLQAVGQLAGGIAHDFNNLLTAVIGAAEDALARISDTETAEDLEQIHASAQRGAALVKQLLAFGRQQTLEPRAIAINAAVESISSLLRRLLGSAIRLDLELEQPGWTVRVDPTQLDQVLVNLACNARDAMTEGGQLTLRTGHVTLYRSLIRGEEVIPPGRYVMVEVQDTGVGIPADVLPRIFDPFFTTRREKGGSGLGLSTVHGIVRQSDGFVAVDSLVGEGTRVRLYLPRADADEVAIPVAPPRNPVEPRATSEGRDCAELGRTILLVDDDNGVRRLAVRALRRANWTVLEADSSEAALAILTEQPGAPLHAVFSDVIMPGMNGPALVRAVRAQYPDIPAILASGYAQESIPANLAAGQHPLYRKALYSQGIGPTCRHAGWPNRAITLCIVCMREISVQTWPPKPSWHAWRGRILGCRPAFDLVNKTRPLYE